MKRQKSRPSMAGAQELSRQQTANQENSILKDFFAFLLRILLVILWIPVRLLRRLMLRWLMRCRCNRFGTMRNRTCMVRVRVWWQKRRTQMWVQALRTIGGSKPRLFDFDGCLPPLPVPDLDETMQKFMRSVEPFYRGDAVVGSFGADELEELTSLAQEFSAGAGKVLQQSLQRYAARPSVGNWLEQFWLDTAYLERRVPLPIYSSYYLMDRADCPPPIRSQLRRAAVLTFEMLRFCHSIRTEVLAPLRIGGAVPFDMGSYRRLFGSVRVPSEECDALETHANSKHVIVCCRSRLFKLCVAEADPLANGGFRYLPISSIEIALSQIAAGVENDVLSISPCVADLTTANRDTWARTRKQLRMLSRRNQDSLAVVESALFVIVLDEDVPNTPTECAQALLCGRGRWFDKTLNLVVYANARAGLLVEHSPGDAPMASHMWECVLARESYDEEGVPVAPNHLDVAPPLLPLVRKMTVFPISFLPYSMGWASKEGAAADGPKFEQLQWEVDGDIRDGIRDAVENLRSEIAQTGIQVTCFEDFGTTSIRNECRCVPDAFFQLALQVAYVRLRRRFPLVYEGAATRQYESGRTEVIRAASSESHAFVHVLLAEERSGDWHQRALALLRSATTEHLRRTQQAVLGKGIDRHLLGLKLTLEGRAGPVRMSDEDRETAEAFFGHPMCTMPWHISTSQTPLCQEYGEGSLAASRRALGGGFGPPEGSHFGVSYFLLPDKIILHTTCRSSQPVEDCVWFSQWVCEALQDMFNICSGGQ